MSYLPHMLTRSRSTQPSQPTSAQLYSPPVQERPTSAFTPPHLPKYAKRTYIIALPNRIPLDYRVLFHSAAISPLVVTRRARFSSRQPPQMRPGSRVNSAQADVSLGFPQGTINEYAPYAATSYHTRAASKLKPGGPIAEKYSQSHLVRSG